jgi:hypothetical protein
VTGTLPAFHLQAAVLGEGYNDFGPLRPVGQDLGGFQDFKGGGRFPGGEDYPVPLNSMGYTFPLFQGYFISGVMAVGSFYVYIENRFTPQQGGYLAGFGLHILSTIKFLRK